MADLARQLRDQVRAAFEAQRGEIANDNRTAPAFADDVCTCADCLSEGNDRG